MAHLAFAGAPIFDPPQKAGAARIGTIALDLSLRIIAAPFSSRSEQLTLPHVYPRVFAMPPARTTISRSVANAAGQTAKTLFFVVVLLRVITGLSLTPRCGPARGR